MNLWPLLVGSLLSSSGLAQSADTTKGSAVHVVRGIVYDSIAHAPLAGATVQLVAADNPARFGRAAITDSLGLYSVADVPGGRYTLGFFHPALDSLGIEAPLKEISVDGKNPVNADLAIPSAKRLRAVICGPRTDADSGAVLVGLVRDAESGAVAGNVLVSAQWAEYSFAAQKVSRRTPRIDTTTGENGWFIICNVPSEGVVALQASRGADSTDLIELEMKRGYMRHEIFLGSARAAVATANPEPGSSRRSKPRTIHTGDGTISGTVLAAVDRRPLIGAQVEIPDGPQTRTNERGEWTLSNAPVGTRMLEVRALGYYPGRVLVHIVPAARPVTVSLATLQSVLDTVKVRSKRITSRTMSGFQERRYAGSGKYLSAAQITKRPAVFLSDIFKTVPGLRLGYASDTLATDMAIAVNPDDMSVSDRRVLMRGISGDWCAPAVYLDGIPVPSMGADDLDAWLRPRDVGGIEIYSEADVPPEFQRGRSGCGSIIIWRK